MVYDPVRDCDIPSPAITRRPSLWDTPPPQPPAFSDNNVPQSHASASHPHSQPQSYSQSQRPRSAVSGSGGGGGSLRNLLNDDVGEGTSRRGSDITVSSFDDDHRPHLSKLLNNDASATHPLVRTNSASSSTHGGGRETSSPRLSSPSVSLHPASAVHGRASRSPMPHPHQALSSSPSTSMGYPYDVVHTTPGGGYGGGPSSRRSSMDTSRPMPPPADPVRQHDLYSTPLAQTAPLRSPSVSVSPRMQHVPLSNPPTSSRQGSARPTSSRSGSGSVHAYPSGGVMSSPDHRRMSDDIVASPVSMRKPYAPAQPSNSYTIRRPIGDDELARLRSLAISNNPLRRKARRAAPVWSAPSPKMSGSHTDGGYDDVAPPPGPSRRGSTVNAAAVNERSELHERPTLSGEGSHSALKRPAPVPVQDYDDRNQRRRVDSYSGVAAEVASHYNSRPDVGVADREYSPIIGLKKFNNWVKSVLIGKFAYRNRGGPGAKVLDIGCGKGGDLNKWRQARISLYVGMDIAATSVDQARERYNTMRGKPFEGYFFAHDCYAYPISDVLPHHLQREMYDNVTMQFCMHYAFETAQKARMMIENVSRYMRRGGMFVGTIPNSELLLARLDEVPEGDELRFGNSCYAISFRERHHKGIYGHEYNFYLEDAVEDVPEYIVDWDNFVSLAAEYGLELEYKKTFNDVLMEEQGSREFGPLLSKMGVINEHGESAMDSDQWEAANLYMAFAFKKVR